MKIKAVIVDVGGVLVQTIDPKPRTSWENKLLLMPGQLAKEVFLHEPAAEATIGKVQPEKIWNDLKKKFKLSDEGIKKLRHDFSAGDKLNLEFYTYMKKLHGHYQTAILSNAWLDAREIYTKKFRLNEVVDTMIISGEVGVRKPNKKIYKYALAIVKCEAKEVIFVDDNKRNVHTANELGMHGIQFTTAEETIKKMNKLLNKPQA